MAQRSVITEEMRAAVGVESEPLVMEVDSSACRLFARAVGHTDLIFYDEEHARSRGYRSIVAPPGYLGTALYRPDKPPPPLGSRRFSTPYKRFLNGGTDIQHFGTICAGDVLTATSKIAEMYEREASIGPMLITVTETTYRNQDGAVVAVLQGTLISY